MEILAAFTAQRNGSASVTNRIVRLNANGAVDAGFNASAAADQPVLSISVQGDGKILLGGKFTRVNGVAQSHIARLMADGSVDLEVADSLSGSAWVQLDSGVGDGSVKTMAAGKATGSMRFFRLRP